MGEDAGDHYRSCRKLYVTVYSATNLPNGHKFFAKTEAYAEISIESAERKDEFKTGVDRNGGLNPTWNHAIACEIDQSDIMLNIGLALNIKLYCKRACCDRCIGEVYVPMKYLYDKARRLGGIATFDWPITQGAAQTSATLRFAISFGEVYAAKKKEFKEKVKTDRKETMEKLLKVLEIAGPIIVDIVKLAADLSVKKY